VKVNPGTDIRGIGSDIKVGETVLQKGDKIGAAEIGILAAVGAMFVDVFTKPVVAILSSGDELVEPNQLPGPGQIRDSNRVMLRSAVRSAGYKAIDSGVMPDTLEATKKKILEVLQKVDVLVTSGGVSMGSHDFVKLALEELGTVHFGRLMMKPGKPATFATLNVEVNGVQQKKIGFCTTRESRIEHVYFLLISSSRTPTLSRPFLPTSSQNISIVGT